MNGLLQWIGRKSHPLSCAHIFQSSLIAELCRMYKEHEVIYPAEQRLPPIISMLTYSSLRQDAIDGYHAGNKSHAMP